jgi:putative transposase
LVPSLHYLSLRDIEELLLERGVTVTYESVRNWCDRFGAQFARCARAARGTPGSTWHLDELFVKLPGEPYVLWRAVDVHGIGLVVLAAARPRRSQTSLQEAAAFASGAT